MVSTEQSHLINTHSGVQPEGSMTETNKFLGKRRRSGGSFARLHRCSSVTARRGDAPYVTPRGRPKSLTAPSVPIYEMTSRSRFHKSLRRRGIAANCSEGKEGRVEGLGTKISSIFRTTAKELRRGWKRRRSRRFEEPTKLRRQGSARQWSEVPPNQQSPEPPDDRQPIRRMNNTNAFLFYAGDAGALWGLAAGIRHGEHGVG